MEMERDLERLRLTESKLDITPVIAPDDKISRLEDDMLLLILERLTLKERGATGRLSRQWRYLWTGTPDLNFIPYRVTYTCTNDLPKFVNFVNGVLRMHRGPNVKTFRVLFDLYHPAYDASRNSWIEFTAQKRASQCELVLLKNRAPGGSMKFSYSSSSDVTTIQLLPPHKKCAASSKLLHPCEHHGLKLLKAIHFEWVQMTAQDLRCFLTSCPFLENVSVVNGRGNFGALFVGSGKMLKSLNIKNCYFPCIIIMNTSIVSFSYIGARLNFLQIWAPSLRDLCIGYTSIVKVSLRQAFEEITDCHRKLEVLKLKNQLTCDMKGKIAEFEALKHLELELDIEGDSCSELLAWFLDASPRLNKLVLKLKIGLGRTGKTAANADVINCAMQRLRSSVPGNIELEFRS